jgi:hypothetical protein
MAKRQRHSNAYKLSVAQICLVVVMFLDSLLGHQGQSIYFVLLISEVKKKMVLVMNF